jgi:hypothetical protein
MRRLSRFLTEHSVQHSMPHARCREELGVIADRHTPITTRLAWASAVEAHDAFAQPEWPPERDALDVPSESVPDVVRA